MWMGQDVGAALPADREASLPTAFCICVDWHDSGRPQMNLICGAGDARPSANRAMAVKHAGLCIGMCEDSWRTN